MKKTMLAILGVVVLNGLCFSAWCANDGDLLARFERVQIGMSVDDVTKIMGASYDHHDRQSFISDKGFLDGQFPYVWHGQRYSFACLMHINGWTVEKKRIMYESTGLTANQR